MKDGESSMNELTDLPNISHTLAKKLNQIGVFTENELHQLGSVGAITKISSLEHGDACINMFYALEGAIQRIRWHELSKEKKDELLYYFRKLIGEKS